MLLKKYCLKLHCYFFEGRRLEKKKPSCESKKQNSDNCKLNQITKRCRKGTKLFKNPKVCYDLQASWACLIGKMPVGCVKKRASSEKLYE